MRANRAENILNGPLVSSQNKEKVEVYIAVFDINGIVQVTRISPSGKPLCYHNQGRFVRIAASKTDFYPKIAVLFSMGAVKDLFDLLP